MGSCLEKPVKSGFAGRRSAWVVRKPDALPSGKLTKSKLHPGNTTGANAPHRPWNLHSAPHSLASCETGDYWHSVGKSVYSGSSGASLKKGLLQKRGSTGVTTAEWNAASAT